ncbi:MAG: GNAT family N-acetyltransferase [Clostridiales bacterium]|nr:GNAT family N-acetyltransferase [Clostridiales bacterium]
MLIRKMTMDDYEEAFEMWLRAGRAGIRAREDSEEGIERFLKRNPDTSFVAEIDGRVVGVLMCGHDGRRGHIYHTAIRDPGRSRTIGRALLAAIEEAMKELGIAKVGLLVDAGNDSGTLFWKQQGWTQRDDLIYFDRSIEKESDS